MWQYIGRVVTNEWYYAVTLLHPWGFCCIWKFCVAKVFPCLFELLSFLTMCLAFCFVCYLVGLVYKVTTSCKI